MKKIEEKYKTRREKKKKKKVVQWSDVKASTKWREKKRYLKGIVKDLIKSIQAQRKANTNLSSTLTRFLRKSGCRFIEKYGFVLIISLKNFQQAVVSEIWMIRLTVTWTEGRVALYVLTHLSVKGVQGNAPLLSRISYITFSFLARIGN